MAPAARMRRVAPWVPLACVACAAHRWIAQFSPRRPIDRSARALMQPQASSRGDDSAVGGRSLSNSMHARMGQAAESMHYE